MKDIKDTKDMKDTKEARLALSDDLGGLFDPCVHVLERIGR